MHATRPMSTGWTAIEDDFETDSSSCSDYDGEEIVDQNRDERVARYSHSLTDIRTISVDKLV